MAETVVLRWHWRTRSSKWTLLSYRLFVHRGDFSRECGSSAPLKQLPWNWMECFMCCLVSLMPGLPPWARQQHLSLSFPLTKCPRISVDYKNKPHKPISPQSPNTHIILVMFSYPAVKLLLHYTGILQVFLFPPLKPFFFVLLAEHRKASNQAIIKSQWRHRMSSRPSHDSYHLE